MKKTRKQNNSKPPTGGVKAYSVNALSKLTGADRKTIDKAIARAQIKPAQMAGSNPQYRLEDIKAALATMSDKTNRDKLLEQQVRKLQLANDKYEGLLILRSLVNATLSSSYGTICRILDQKLEREYPAMVQGLDLAGCCVKGKQLNDSIRAELRKVLETYPE